MTSWLARRDRQQAPGPNGTGTALPIALAMLPTPIADDIYGAKPFLGGKRPSGAKRQIHLSDVVAHRLAGHGSPAVEPEPGAGRLLPTPDTGYSPSGHGRRGGRPGNGHQSGLSLDATASRAGQDPAAWGEYAPAIRRWEHVLGRPAPPPAEPGRPGGRARLSAAFAEWMMGLSPGFVTGVPGIPRTRQLAIIGNGVVPQQASAALRLLITTAADPAPHAPDPGTRTAP